MSEASPVGALQVPLPAVPAGTTLADPALDALRDFAAFYIKDALDARLATIAPVGTVLDAVPVANRFGFDPLEPRGHSIKLPVPALFVYWAKVSKLVQWTTVKWYRERELHLLYVFPELPAIEQLIERQGLLGAVDAALHKMSRRQANDAFTPTGGAPGQYVSSAVAPINFVDWRYVGGRPGRFGIDEGPLAERRAAKRSGRDFPALIGQFEVMELIDGLSVLDPQDVTPNIATTVTTDGLPMLDHFLPSPDGSEFNDQQ